MDIFVISVLSNVVSIHRYKPFPQQLSGVPTDFQEHKGILRPEFENRSHEDVS